MKMELKDFISKTITDICYGIDKAQRVLYKELKNCPIAPYSFMGKQLDNLEQKISFDICYDTMKLHEILDYYEK